MIELKHDRLVGGKLKYGHLLGRKFKLGSDDCLGMLRNMFKDNLNIDITNYARPTDFWLEGINLYVDYYKQEGFRLMDDLHPNEIRPFDTFLIAIPDARSRGKVITNHCAIYLGEGQVIHHRYGCLSQVVPYRGPLRNMTTHIIRHKDVPDLVNRTESKLDLMDYILPHKREMLKKAMEEQNGQTSN